MVIDPGGRRRLILVAAALVLTSLAGGDALSQAAEGVTQAASPEVQQTLSRPAAEAGAHAAAGIDHLGPMGMFMAADIVVKTVMVSLALASCVTWTIALAKFVELASAGRRTRRALAALAEAGSLADAKAGLSGRTGPVVLFVAGAADEAERSSGLSDAGVKERAAALLARIEARAGRTMTRGTGLLATIGSVSPFVGLFGTVWGIMNSFIGIAKSNTTNLAVVAPGIAEALLATAIGLVAAIPAVVLYNVFARAIAGYRAALGDASGEVLRHLSRDLDRARMAGGPVVRRQVAHNQAAE